MSRIRSKRISRSRSRRMDRIRIRRWNLLISSWELVDTVYRKGGTTQMASTEMTYEEMQQQLGLGVDCG